MAGLKTSSRKKRDASKPNTILVVFLVIFILTSIGLGVWGYYGYAGQEKYEKDAKNAINKAKAETENADFHTFLGTEARIAIGGADNPNEVVVDPDDKEKVAQLRKDFIDPNSKFKTEKSYARYAAPMAKLLDAFQGDLGAYDEATKKYPETYRGKLTKLNNELKSTQAKLETTQQELKASEDKFTKLKLAQDDSWKKAMTDIRNGNAESLKAATDKTKEMKTLFDINEKLNAAIEETKKKSEEEGTSYKRTISKLQKELLEKNDGQAVLGNARAGGDGQLNALLLDISRGRPLWDAPLGKITRLNLQARQVYINLGSANGMKTETSFNVFGAGPNGRADKQLKASIEVIRVLDANSSLARITGLYDTEGNEIVLGDSRGGRSIREADNALKEGDLLFNTFWGSRVAIAGNIQFAGQSSDNPAEQMRILEGFINFLGRNGITVDAYLDLNDGQIKGAFVPGRTRYLIRGDDLIDPAQVPAKLKAAVPAEGDDKQEAPAAPPSRIKSINDTAAKMRLEAADKGLFIISTENFLNVIGYRQPRSASLTEPTGFRPTPITINQPGQNPPDQVAPVPDKMDNKGP